MSRNSEKAQSMLYRFREDQAKAMGMGDRQKGERRPRMASSVTNLRDCERYRGDILRDVSRKVSKIQDATLSDYQIRDLNDEINSLLREKRHYETQIVNLGGANYKRGNTAMLDDEGKEVAGTRGYKYFGRARELPGVKEMFNKSSAQATEDSARNASFQMFRNQGPDYYGDFDETDPGLIEEEDEQSRAAWAEAVAQTAAVLGLDEDSANVPYPYPSASGSTSTSAGAAEESEPAKGGGKGKGKKRAAAGGTESTKKAKTDTDTAGEDGGEEQDQEAPALEVTNGAAPAGIQHAFLDMLDPASLRHPTVPSTDEMSRILLEVRKNAIRQEYGV